MSSRDLALQQLCHPMPEACREPKNLEHHLHGFGKTINPFASCKLIGVTFANSCFRPDDAERLPGLSMLIKQRSGASQIERMDLVGNEIHGRDVILVDDMVDTAGTLCAAAQRCKESGARRVFAFCTHGLLSGSAPLRLAKACSEGFLDALVVTDSVPQRPSADWNGACEGFKPPTVKILSVAPMLAESIKRLALDDHISTLSLSKL